MLLFLRNYQESLLISAIEESQPADDKIDANALRDLSAEEDSIFQPSQGSRVLPKMSKRSIFAKSATKDTTMHLFDLAEKLQAAQKRSHKAHEAGLENGDAAATTEGGGQSDLLAFHAAKILSQRRKEKAKAADEAAAASSGQPAAANKWSKLRAAVQMNSAVSDFGKKSDDEAVPNEVSAGISENKTDENNSHDDADDAENGAIMHHQDSNGATKTKKEMKKTDGLNAEYQAFR